MWSIVVDRGFWTGGNALRGIAFGVAERVGDEVDDRDDVRCTGFRPIGGGALFEDAVELVDRRLSGPGTVFDGPSLPDWAS